METSFRHEYLRGISTCLWKHTVPWRAAKLPSAYKVSEDRQQWARSVLSTKHNKTNAKSSTRNYHRTKTTPSAFSVTYSCLVCRHDADCSTGLELQVISRLHDDFPTSRDMVETLNPPPMDRKHHRDSTRVPR